MEFSKKDLQEIIELEIKQAEKRFGKEFKMTLLKILSYEKMMNPDSEKTYKEPIPLSEWNKHHSYPTVRAMRNYYFNRETNGFDYCVEYGGENGGRILINEDKFFEWRKNRKSIKN